MTTSADRIAVVGATGYVGQRVCPMLRAAGFDVTAVCHENRAFLVKRLGVRTVTPDRVGLEPAFPFVLNLAYPTSRQFYKHCQQNRGIVDSVRRLVAQGGLVVHTSTLAVFGMDLDQPMVAGPVPRRRDIPYVESKLDMEHRLMVVVPPVARLRIVRLGNVWGPGSPVWTANLAQRLIEGRPVGVHGEDGFSNCTDVANVGAYVAHLFRAGGNDQVQFHHLAEHAGVNWSAFVDVLAAELGATPVRVLGVSRAAKSMGQELREGFRGLRIGSVIKDSLKGPRLGSLVRAGMAALPDRYVERFVDRAKPRMSLTGPVGDAATVEFLRLLTCPREFALGVPAEWVPARDLGQCFAETATWLRSAGFTPQAVARE